MVQRIFSLKLSVSSCNLLPHFQFFLGKSDKEQIRRRSGYQRISRLLT